MAGKPRKVSGMVNPEASRLSEKLDDLMHGNAEIKFKVRHTFIEDAFKQDKLSESYGY